MYAEERQQAIARSVTKAGRMSVAELAATYRVTTETIRRDLSTLERAGLVRRVHGGVVPADALTVLETGVSDRDRANAAEKDRIATSALELVPEGGSIVVDAGTWHDVADALRGVLGDSTTLAQLAESVRNTGLDERFLASSMIKSWSGLLSDAD